MVVKVSPRNNRPEKAANAGCRLVRILKVLAGICLSATKSKEKGSALDKIATPNPFKSVSGVRLSKAPSQSAKGIMTSVAISMPVVTAFFPSITCAILPPTTIYTAQNIPAKKASPKPIMSMLLLCQGTINKMPAQANNAQTTSNNRRESTSAKNKGPINSMVTPKPNGIR